MDRTENDHTTLCLFGIVVDFWLVSLSIRFRRFVLFCFSFLSFSLNMDFLSFNSTNQVIMMTSFRLLNIQSFRFLVYSQEFCDFRWSFFFMDIYNITVRSLMYCDLVSLTEKSSVWSGFGSVFASTRSIFMLLFYNKI